MRIWLQSAVGLGALSLTACAYIGPEPYIIKVGCLDEDGDSAPKEPNEACSDVPRDCDDDDAARAPQHEEVPYDRVDQDCDSGKFDLVDVDGDGYPGITKDDWLEQTRVYGDLAEWPPGLADAFDCDDGNGDVNPGVSEAPYDGIDQDCAGGNDFDADGDGFEAAAHGGDDCDDSEARIHPGAPDTWYDGEDTDCGGEDDFDQDGDGFGADAGDCDDLDVAVAPGLADAPYDGVDADCEGDDDFDADGDHYHDAAWDTAYADYVVAWDLPTVSCHSATTAGGLGVCSGHDCDDADPSAHPHDADDANAAATERLGDAVDQDCDGGADSGRLWDGGFTWDAPRGVSVANNGRHWLIGTGASSTSAESAREGGVVVWFDTDATAEAPPNSSTWFTITPVPVMGDAIDLIASPDGFEAVVGYRTLTASFLMVKHGTWNEASNYYVASRTVYRQIDATQETFRSVGITRDSTGRVWAFGAADNLLAYVVGDGNLSTFPKLSMGSVARTGPTGGVFLDVAPGTTGTATTCDTSACTSLTLDVNGTLGTITTAVSQPYAAAASVAQGVRARAFVPASGTGATWLDAAGTSRTVFPGKVVRRAAVDVDGASMFAAAIVADASGDGVDDLAVSYGPIDGPHTVVVAPAMLDGKVITPSRVDVAVASGRVLIALTGAPADGSCADPNDVQCDVVAWSVVQAP